MLMEDVLPDIIHSSGANLDQAGMDGAMIPLEDLVEKYAPNIHKYFQEHPDHLEMNKAYDGHLYYIPTFSIEGPSQGWIIRQDWLDKLGLEAPKTKDEFYNVMKAFREQDPNGNGRKDEIPYLNRTKTPLGLLGLFGIDNRNYVVKDGKVICNVATEEYKQAITEIAQWYKEGLIDPEIYTRNNAREELFANNNGGMTVDWLSSTYSYNETLSKEALGDSYFGFELVTIDPPKDINGDQIIWNVWNPIASTGWGISKDNKYIAETMKFFDYWYTDEGRTNLWFGPDHKINPDGTPDYSDEARAYVGGPTEYNESQGAALGLGSVRLVEAEVGAMPEVAQKAFWHYKNNFKLATPFPTFKHTPEEKRVMKSQGTDIATYISEMQQNWVLGNKDVEATWDEFIAHLNELGLKDVLAAYQSAYDRMYK